MSFVSTSKEIPKDICVEQFGRNLFKYIFLRLGVVQGDPFEVIPTLEDGLFTESIGRAVLYHQMLVRSGLWCFFTCHFNRIIADVGAIAYEFCSRMYAFSHDSFRKKFFRLSAFVVELFLYCRESSVQDAELTKAPLVWKTIFDVVMKTDFYRQEGGWAQIAATSRYYCEQLSRHFEPLIERFEGAYSEFPTVADLPKEFANTDQELHEVFEKSYGATTLHYLKNIPPPLFFKRIDEDSGMDGLGRDCSSPSPKRHKRVHQILN